MNSVNNRLSPSIINYQVLESEAKSHEEHTQQRPNEAHNEHDSETENSFLLAGHEYANSSGVLHQIQHYLAQTFLSSPQEPVSLSNQLIQEITKWSSGSLNNILNDLQTLQNAISSVTDAATLATLQTNIEAFDAIRAQKSEQSAEWDKIQDFVMQIEMEIYTQELNLPTTDKDALLKKMTALINDILAKLDQFSPEEITAIINQMANLQAQVDGLSQDLQQQIATQIQNLKTQIDQEVSHQIQGIKDEMLRNLIMDFEAALKDYLSKGDNINTLLAKQYEVNQQKGPDVLALINTIVTNNFSLSDFNRWVDFVNGIENGDSDLTPPNVSLANSVRATCVNIIKQQSLLTQVDGYITYENVFVSQALLGAYLDPANAKQIFTDLATTVASVSQLNAIKNHIGSKIFTHDNFKSLFNFETVIPILPSGLTLDLLTQPCPFDASKKTWQTHFLFYIPQAIQGQSSVSWQSFVSGFNSNDNNFNLNDAHFWWRDSVENTPYNDGKWVLLYQINQSNVPNGYSLASITDIIPGLKFWIVSENGPSFLYDLWPTGQGGIFHIQEYPTAMISGASAIEFRNFDYSFNASKILLRNLY